MDLITAITTYFLLWWVIFMPTLSFGYKKHSSQGRGFAASAPQKTYLKEKVIVTSLLTALILLIVHLLIVYEIIHPYEFFFGVDEYSAI